MNIEDRSILITGASRGIGRAWSLALHAAGANVIATCRNPSDAPELIEAGLRVEALDVTSDASVAALVKTLAGAPIETLINNAGIFGPKDQTLATVDLQTFDAIYQTNVLGALRVTRAFIPTLRGQDSPWVVNVSSRVGSIGGNENGTIAGYRMSKAAMNMFTRTLSIDEPNLSVVSIHPGWVQTDMGGAEASLTIDESVTALCGLLSQFNAASNGRFFNYTGEELPW